MKNPVKLSDDFYTVDDLAKNLSKIESHATIHYAEKDEIQDGEVVNHMPYNSGKFFEKTESDKDFFEKSIQNDINFCKTIFG